MDRGESPSLELLIRHIARKHGIQGECAITVHFRYYVAVLTSRAGWRRAIRSHAVLETSGSFCWLRFRLPNTVLAATTSMPSYLFKSLNLSPTRQREIWS